VYRNFHIFPVISLNTSREDDVMDNPKIPIFRGMMEGDLHTPLSWKICCSYFHRFIPEQEKMFL